MNNFYVYILLHPITELPLYVGKGKGYRAFSHLSVRRKSYISNKIFKIKKKLGLDPKIIFHKIDLSPEEAYLEERNLIKQLGRKDNGTGILYNLTDGGEGPANRILSDIHKQRLSTSLKGKSPSIIVRQKLSIALKGRKNTWGDKISKSLSGSKLTDERKQKISTARKLYFEKHPEAKIAFFKGCTHSEESKIKMSSSLKVALAKPETKLKRSIANKGGNNPRAKKCMYNGQLFSCISDAEKALKMYKSKLKRDPLFSFV